MSHRRVTERYGCEDACDYKGCVGPHELTLDHCSITNTVAIEVDGQRLHFYDDQFRAVLRAAKKMGFYRRCFEEEGAQEMPEENLPARLPPERPVAPVELAVGMKVRLTAYGLCVIQRAAERVAKEFMGVKYADQPQVKAGDEGFVQKRVGESVWECKFFSSVYLVIDGYMVEVA